MKNEGEKSNFVYYVENFVRYIYPKILCRMLTNRILLKAGKRDDYDYISDRVNYYNKLDNIFLLENRNTSAKLVNKFLYNL